MEYTIETNEEEHLFKLFIPKQDSVSESITGSILHYEADHPLVLNYALFDVEINIHTFCDGKGTIVFDGTLTQIDDYAFNESVKKGLPTSGRLKSIIIPEGVTRIGKYAFESCVHLSEIKIPQSVTTIDKGAFYFCSLK